MWPHPVQRKNLSGLRLTGDCGQQQSQNHHGSAYPEPGPKGVADASIHPLILERRFRVGHPGSPPPTPKTRRTIWTVYTAMTTVKAFRSADWLTRPSTSDP